MVSGARPVIGHIREFARDGERLLWRGFREHGLIFQMKMPGSNPSVVLLGQEHSKRFFTDESMSTAAAYPFLGRMFAPDFYSLGGKETYRQQKDIMLPRFQGAALDDYVEVMNSQADRFLEKLGDAGEFELTDTFGPLVMEIAARAFLGERFAEEMPGKDFFDEYRTFSEGLNFMPGWLPTPTGFRADRARDRLKAAMGAMIAQRRRGTAEEFPDFLFTLAESTYEDGTPVEVDVLVNIVLLLVWAGHETTTGALSWVLADLLQHPEDLRRARAEAEAVLAEGPLDLAASRKLKFLEACLYASEQAHPISPVLLRNLLQEVRIGGYTLPAGTVVFAAPMVTHQLKDGQPWANDFRPDLFLGPDAKTYKAAMIGFGGGVHRCLGVNFARMEMRILLARLLVGLDFELTTGAPRPPRRTETRWPESPCAVRYRARPPAAADSGAVPAPNTDVADPGPRCPLS
ncbi:cytochrome P450 [Nocardia sp. NPDC048505]|uniref:cytochrome P450 n=1 Tax=unclassified Nocardia TaxID=2637762 RepID=UPI0033C74D82